MNKLTLINGGKPEHEVLACQECNGTTLIPGVSSCIDVEHVEDGLHIIGGVDLLICAQCLAEGKVTTVFR